MSLAMIIAATNVSALADRTFALVSLLVLGLIVAVSLLGVVLDRRRRVRRRLLESSQRLGSRN
ncbi:MAG: hypothetical protein J2P54_13360 [Bradyrhizobiaceae bacterium]|nr:hypothetical protein [Bradyrhizobiaceae bacterium]